MGTAGGAGGILRRVPPHPPRKYPSEAMDRYARNPHTRAGRQPHRQGEHSLLVQGVPSLGYNSRARCKGGRASQGTHGRGAPEPLPALVGKNKPTRVRIDTMSTTPEQLADVVQLTSMLRVKEREAIRIAERRRQAILRHRAATPPVSYADLAKAMGMSEARLYKIIKGKNESVPRGPRAVG